MNNILGTILMILLIPTITLSQEYREKYETTSSYDLKVEDKMSDKKSGKVYRDNIIKARIYYNGSNDFVIVEQLELNSNKPLEMSIIDFKKGTHILLKDKSSKNAIVKSYSNKIPSYMKEEYTYETIETIEKDSQSVTLASYKVDDMDKVNAKLEVIKDNGAPSILKWMPVIQHDLGTEFPLNIYYMSEGRMGMLNKASYKTSNFQSENPFSFTTTDLILGSPSRSKEDRTGGEVYGK